MKGSDREEGVRTRVLDQNKSKRGPARPQQTKIKSKPDVRGTLRSITKPSRIFLLVGI